MFYLETTGKTWVCTQQFATDALVLKHQVISTHSVDQIVIAI